jgi:hypothetical protein
MENVGSIIRGIVAPGGGRVINHFGKVSGVVHPTAEFDHSLYYQPPRSPRAWNNGEIDLNALSPRPSDQSRDECAFRNVSTLALLPEVLDAEASVYRRRLAGELPNADTWVLTA